MYYMVYIITTDCCILVSNDNNEWCI